MTYEQIDARKEYVKRARASFQDQEEDWTHPAPEHEEPALGRTFSLRLVLGLFLFLLFVLANAFSLLSAGISSSRIPLKCNKFLHPHSIKCFVAIFPPQTLLRKLPQKMIIQILKNML